MPPRTPHNPPHASHAHPRSQVQDGPINQRWAANIQDEALSGVVSDLSDIADIDVRNQVRRRGFEHSRSRKHSRARLSPA